VKFNVKWPFKVIQGHVFGVSGNTRRDYLHRRYLKVTDGQIAIPRFALRASRGKNGLVLLDCNSAHDVLANAPMPVTYIDLKRSVEVRLNNITK